MTKHHPVVMQVHCRFYMFPFSSIFQLIVISLTRIYEGNTSRFCVVCHGSHTCSKSWARIATAFSTARYRPSSKEHRDVCFRHVAKRDVFGAMQYDAIVIIVTNVL